MVAQEFFTLVSQFKITGYVGLEDFADKFNFLYTVILLLICTLITTTRTYLLKPIACYIATAADGKGMDDYVDNYCWIEGTRNVDVDTAVPHVPENEKKIFYYQWVPFVLAIQCILFYIPNIFWQSIIHNITGTDFQHLAITANQAAQQDPETRKNTIQHIARLLENIIFYYRNNKEGRLADLQRKFAFCWLTKRFGAGIIAWYLLTKLMYLVNSVGQVFLMEHFLGFDGHSTNFGLKVLQNIATGQDWNMTRLFPRVTFCTVTVQHVGYSNKVTAQCVLPVNMLNEKIYIFLWFWIIFASLLTAISLPLWFVKLIYTKNQTRFVKKYLRICDYYNQTDRVFVKNFIQQFLRRDGVFIIRMLALNAGDFVTSEIIAALYQIWKHKYKDLDLRRYTAADSKDFVMFKNSPLPLNGNCLLAKRCKATAPNFV